MVHNIKENSLISSNSQDQAPAQVQPRFPIIASMQPPKPKARVLVGMGQKVGKGEDYVDDSVLEFRIKRPPGTAETPAA